MRVLILKWRGFFKRRWERYVTHTTLCNCHCDSCQHYTEKILLPSKRFSSKWCDNCYANSNHIDILDYWDRSS
jgi:hypothetical protein